VFDTSSFDVCGARERSTVRLWTLTPDGRIAMEAAAELA